MSSFTQHEQNLKDLKAMGYDVSNSDIAPYESWQYDELDSLVQDLISQARWICVDDDLPECDIEVMTWDGCDRGLDYCNMEVESGTVYFANDEHHNITHWQSIPLPPE